MDATQSIPVKLNYFQRLMWHWSQLAAYNAVHLIQLSGVPDVKRWREVAITTFNEIGLGYPLFHSDKSVSFTPLSALQIETPFSLEQHINQELNRTFVNDELPLRIFIVAEENAYYLGVTYNHWVADAYAIRIMMMRMVARYRNDHVLPSSLLFPTSSFGKLFRKHLGRLPGMLWIAEMCRSIKQFYHAYRLPLKDKLDFRCGHITETLLEQEVTHIKSYCKKIQVNLNDVCIAVLAKMMGEFSAQKRYREKSQRWGGKRDRIAISTVADIRYTADQPMDHILGQYLSSYTLVLPSPETIPLDSLAQKIYRHTSGIKNSSRIVRSHYNFHTALKLWKYAKNIKRRAELFYKHSPICAGISNVYVQNDGLLPDSETTQTKVLEYWRASPTGPLLPLVFSITTFRRKMKVCLVYRCTAIGEQDARHLCKSFCEELKKLGVS